MSKWGRCDFRQLKQLNERMEKLMVLTSISFAAKPLKTLRGGC